MAATPHPALSDFDRAVTAHARHYVALIEREGPMLRGAGTPDGGLAQLTAVKLLGIELDNLFEARDTAIHRGALDWLLPLARYLRLYLDMTGGSRQQRQSYSLLLAAAQQLGSAELELAAQLGVCQAQARLGGHDAARLAGHAARELAIRLGDRKGEASALNNLAYVENVLGNYSTARELFAQAVEILRNLGDLLNEAYSLNNLGAVELHQGDYNAACELCAQALAIFRGLGDMHGEAYCINNLGVVEMQQGCYGAARELCMQALAIFRSLGARHFEALVLNNLGNIKSLQGSYSAAGELCAQALAMRRGLVDEPGITASCISSGAVLAGLGRLRFAALALHGAVACSTGLGYRFDPIVRPALDAGLARLDAAVASGELSAEEYGQLKLAAAALTLDKLAELTLKALEETGGGERLKAEG